MKKVILIVVAVICFGIGANAQSSGKTPAEIERSIYVQLQNGNYEKANDIVWNNYAYKNYLSKKTDGDFVSIATFRKEVNSKGGIKSFEIKQQIAANGESATVIVTLRFGNGSLDTYASEYSKDSSGWQIITWGL
jgi:hypothetical protein